MKIIKRLAIPVAFIILRPCASSAEFVSPDDARRIAFECLSCKTATKSVPDNIRLSFTSLDLAIGTKSDYDALPTFYCFTAENGGGFAVISAENRVKPVLAYSDSGTMPDDANLPPALKHWLLYVNERIIGARQMPETDFANSGTLRTSTSSTGKTIALYETALWDQVEPFNLQCPDDNGKPSLTGCTITAIAILMRYYKWPVKGNGCINSYYTFWKSIYVPSRDLNHTYDWDNMLIDYNGGYNDVQSAAVATLMADLAIALNADFSRESTSAAIKTEVLSENFGYDAGCYRCPKSHWEESEWEKELISRIKKDGPQLYVGYGSSGHVFVLDGVRDDGYFHINWGWNGFANGFFTLDALIPAEGSYFMENNSAYFNLVPPDNSNVATDWLKLENAGLSSSAVSYSVQEPFDISAGSIYNGTRLDFSGAVRPALVNVRGEIKEWISDEKRVDLKSSGSTSLAFDCVISSELKIGDYIACYYRSDNDDNWYAVKAAYGDAIWKIPVRDPLSIEESTSVQYDRNNGQITITYKDGVCATARLNGEPILEGTAYVRNSLVLNTRAIGKGEYTILLEKADERKEFIINVKSL